MGQCQKANLKSNLVRSTFMEGLDKRQKATEGSDQLEQNEQRDSESEGG